MTKKKSEPNPIEEAIGERAKDPKAHEKFTKEYQAELIPQNPSEIQDVPSPQEMLSLEELNRQTEERLQDQYPEEEPQVGTSPQESITVPQEATTIPVLKPDPQPATKTSSPASPPPQKSEKPIDFFEKGIVKVAEEIDEYQDAVKGSDIAKSMEESINEVGIKTQPAEDVELTALRKYILEDGFVLATVSFHIVSLCAEPLTTPSTTTWDFADRAMIPEMVFALLNQPGYIEGIWPSLKIVMGSNAGNAAWTAGIATTIAFFDIIRSLPTIEELKNERI